MIHNGHNYAHLRKKRRQKQRLKGGIIKSCDTDDGWAEKTKKMKK